MVADQTIGSPIFKMRAFFNIAVFSILTVVTQLGGIAWLIALLFRRRLLAFVLAYLAISVSAVLVAPHFGRVAINCFGSGPLEVQSWMYCALNRNYVSPELADVLEDTAEAVAIRYPGTKTLLLDANFPFFKGFPLLPHLSHDDGEKADLAFYYRDETGYLAGATRSPIGYFAFETGPTDCSKTWPSLRWDFDLAQLVWHDYELDAERTRKVLQVLSSDDRVGKVFIEPHMVKSLGLAHPKIRFQGCRAARHDDHIHFQL